MTIFKRKKTKEEPKKVYRKEKICSEKEIKKAEKERIDAFNDALKDLAVFKKVNGFIFLVDAEHDESLPKGVNGLRVWCGPRPVLANLVSCIEGDGLLKEGYERQKVRDAIGGLGKLLDELKENLEKDSKKAKKTRK